MLGQLVEHLAEALIMYGGIGSMHHDVVQVEQHSWDAAKDGGHDVMETAGRQVQTEKHAGAAKDANVCDESSEVLAAGVYGNLEVALSQVVY